MCGHCIATRRTQVKRFSPRAGVPVEGLAPGTAVSGGLAGRDHARCREQIARRGPDVIQVITPDPSSVVFIKAGHELGIPVLYQEVGIPFHPPGYESYYEHFISALPFCAEVAALSPTLAEMCRAVVPPGKPVSILPVMADDMSAPPSRAEGGVVFGFAARAETLKGVSELMEAFGLARREDEGVRLYTACAGSKVDEMLERAEAFGAGSHFKPLGVYEGPEGRADFLNLSARPVSQTRCVARLYEKARHALRLRASSMIMTSTSRPAARTLSTERASRRGREQVLMMTLTPGIVGSRQLKPRRNLTLTAICHLLNRGAAPPAG